MKKITPLYIQVIFICGLCSSGLTFAKETPPLSIQTITSIAEPAPASLSGKNFSLVIKFTAHKTVTNWALGFYMPRTLNQLINTHTNIAVNPDLTLEICHAAIDNNCHNLYYVKQSHTFNSAGYASILAPHNQVSLIAGNTYLLKINKSNQGAPTNYSAMPQSFFLIENDKKISAINDPSAEQYYLKNYDASQISSATRKHLYDNWNKSQPLIPNNLSDQLHLLPTPVSIRLLNQAGFNFLPNSSISFVNEFIKDHNNKAMLSSFLKKDLNIQLTNEPHKTKIIIKKRKTKNPEGYQLKIANNEINISASTPAGVFYAIQTLRQLWHQNKTLRSMIIEDYPRFAYRGLLLDVSRHYFTVAEIKKLIDAMAMQKLNTLHIHFADDEGFRLDLSNHPNDPLKKLIKVGARRGFAKHSVLQPAFLNQANLDISNRENFSPTGKIIQIHYDKANERYSGFYSKDDIKNLIRYANARQITIIPEIDLPGHARALVYALPHVFKDENDKSQYSSAQGYTDNVVPICLYNKTSRQGKKFTNTTEEIIKRINQLFANQSTIYHQNEVSLAGDEVSHQAFSHDSSCNWPWSSLSALQKSHYFFSLLQRKTHLLFSGWQQLVQNDDGTIGAHALPKDHVAHLFVWEKTGNGNNLEGIKHAANLANAGFGTVLAFADDTYFDLTYTAEKWEPGFKWAGAYLDTHAALQSSFDALQTENLIHPAQKNNLLGIEGTLWSENLSNFSHLIYMAMPKMTGLAEASWAQSKTTTTLDGKLNWQSLAYRLGVYDDHGFLNYFYRITHLKYRGYPNGISHEIPAEIKKLLAQ